MSLVSRALFARHLALQAEGEAAMDYFKDYPDFPVVQVQVLDGMEALKQQDSEPPRTPGRLKFALSLLDIRCAGFLTLVEDMRAQEAYMKLVVAFGRKAVEEYAGFSSADVLFNGATAAERSISDRVRYWQTEGYRQLANRRKQDSPADASDRAVDSVAPQDEEAREKLLNEYKTATGNPSNRQIYTARNSGIHKPQFYEWLNGELPAESETAKNFERFLKAKKAPIPRTPKH